METSAVEVATSNLHTKKSNLIYALRAATKRVQDRAALESLDEAQPEVRILCAVLEHVVSFRMKLQVGWFGADDKLSFWQFLSSSLRKNPQFATRLQAVEAIETLRSDLAKERAFLRISLMEKSLAEVIAFLSSQKEKIRAHFNDGSFFSEGTRSNRILLEVARRLAALDFSFDVRSQQTLSAPFIIEIDYAALSSVTSARHSDPVHRETSPITADEVIVLSGSHNASNTGSTQNLMVRSEVSNVDKNVNASSPKTEGDRFGKLEARLRNLIEQNAYLDSLVRDQQAQIDRLVAKHADNDKQFAALQSAHTTELRTYEQTILELQVQLTLMREQHERELSRMRDAYENPACYSEMGGRLAAVEMRPLRSSASSNQVVQPSSNSSARASNARAPVINAPPNASPKSTSSPPVGPSAANDADGPRLATCDSVPYVETGHVPPSQLVIPSLKTFEATDESVTPTSPAAFDAVRDSHRLMTRHSASPTTSNHSDRNGVSSRNGNTPTRAGTAEKARSTSVSSDNNVVKRAGTDTPSSIASTSSFEVVTGAFASPAPSDTPTRTSPRPQFDSSATQGELSDTLKA